MKGVLFGKLGIARFGVDRKESRGDISLRPARRFIALGALEKLG